MAANPPQGDSEILTSAEDLRAYFQASETPRDLWRVGTEHEKMGFYRATRSPIPYEGARGIRAFLQAFIDTYGWSPVMEGDTLVALTRDEAAITLEPAGQLELSGAPLKTAHDTCRELYGHIAELRRISDPWDVGWLTLGRNPITRNDDLPWMPKGRYAIMRNYLPRRGSMALDMMLGTGTVQTNIDYADERDMAAKMRLASAVAPILTALYANSPFAGGQPTGFLSTRAHVWQNTDPDRCGIPPAVFRGDFGYGDYIDFALDVPMFFIQREGRYLDYAGKSFRSFLSDGLDGHRATQADWILHLSTLFPEARLKNVVELRMVDVGPLPMICSLPALTRGLFYDDGALAEATELVGALEPNSYPELQRDAARLALAAQAGGKPLLEWARELLHIAAAGLGRLNAVDSKGENEVKYLDPLFRIVETGKTHADLLLEHWRGDWKGSVEPLFNEEMML